MIWVQFLDLTWWRKERTDLQRLSFGFHVSAVVRAHTCYYLCPSTDNTKAKLTRSQSGSEWTHELFHRFSLVAPGLICAWHRIGLNSHIKEMNDGMVRHTKREQLPFFLSPQWAGEIVSTGTCESWIRGSSCLLNCRCHIGPQNLALQVPDTFHLCQWMTSPSIPKSSQFSNSIIW